MELEVNTEVNLLGNNLTENNINILKKVAFRYAEDIVSISNGDLSSGDIERIKFIVNNIVNNYTMQNKGRSITLYYRVIDGKKDFSYIDGNSDKVDIFDQLFYNKEKLLSYNTKPFFIFHNDDINERDGGIDIGGLTKITFHELSKCISGKFFVIDNDAKYYSFNTSFECS